MSLESLNQQVEQARVVCQVTPMIGRDMLIDALKERGQYYQENQEPDLAAADFEEADRLSQSGASSTPSDGEDLDAFFSALDDDQNHLNQQIGHYQIQESLGVGSVTIAYKAYDMRLERDVVLKLIRTDEVPESQYDQLAQQFEKAVKTQAKFSHSNIVPIFDYGRYENVPYIVMAYQSGGTLADRDWSLMSVDDVLDIIIPISDALVYAHTLGVLHQNVKPSNILFNTAGRPMLTDFGMVDIFDTAGSASFQTNPYQAPEQQQNIDGSEASDQFAVGVLLYGMLTGHFPYEDDMMPNSIPPKIQVILSRVLSPEPDQRYDSMRQFQKALEECRVKPVSQSHTPVPAFNVNTPTQVATTPYPPAPTQTPAQTAAGTATAAGASKSENRLLKGLLTFAAALVIVVILGLTIVFGLSCIDSGKQGEGLCAFMFPDAVSETNAAITETEAMAEEETAVTQEAAEEIVVPPTLTLTVTSTPTEPPPTPTVAETEEEFVIQTGINPKDNAILVYVPAGEFTMGSEHDYASPDQAPEHVVYLDDFWIYQTEVANWQYRQCIKAGKCTGDLDRYKDDEYPATYIEWSEAVAYCSWAGGQLPTEAQWEKAARGDEARVYPWGVEAPKEHLANFNDNVGAPMPVGSYPDGASPYGALDMAGNVWEWVYDWYSPNYYGISPYENPTGPLSGDDKVLRGGGYGDIAKALWSTFRHKFSETWNDERNGFRCIMNSLP